MGHCAYSYAFFQQEEKDIFEFCYQNSLNATLLEILLKS